VACLCATGFLKLPEWYWSGSGIFLDGALADGGDLASCVTDGGGAGGAGRPPGFLTTSLLLQVWIWFRRWVLGTQVGEMDVIGIVLTVTRLRESQWE
jgi:hypothetical protein